ncbi:MAG: YcxB family protein [Lachnospiraceae bacterium]|nr:YcxB family protein [Lachnospiraceae bacterium]
MGKKYEVQLTAGDMLRFQLRHAYTSIAGIITIAMSLIGLYMLITMWGQFNDTYRLALIFVALYAPVVEPLRLYLRARKQIKAAQLSKAIDYEFEEEGVIITQEDVRVPIPWSAVKKLKQTKAAIYMYLDSMRCYIFPNRFLDGDEAAIAAYIKAHMGASK